MSSAAEAPIQGAFVPPTVHPVAQVRHEFDFLEVAAEVNGRWRFVSLQVWRPGPDGNPVAAYHRRLTLRLEDVETVAAAIQAAAARAATLEQEEAAP